MTAYPTKSVPDADKCREQILAWMNEKRVTYRELEARTGIAASNLNAMLKGSRPLGLSSIERIYSKMNRSEKSEGVEGAIETLERGCKLYCGWYDNGDPFMDGSTMAYELVSCMRQALEKLSKR